VSTEVKDEASSAEISRTTIAHYEDQAEQFWMDTRDHDLERWMGFANDAGFDEIRRYYRPDGLPREQQPWLASLWRRRDER
jgi:hypothetical protein